MSAPPAMWQVCRDCGHGPGPLLCSECLKVAKALGLTPAARLDMLNETDPVLF